MLFKLGQVVLQLDITPDQKILYPFDEDYLPFLTDEKGQICFDYHYQRIVINDGMLLAFDSGSNWSFYRKENSWGYNFVDGEQKSYLWCKYNEIDQKGVVIIDPDSSVKRKSSLVLDGRLIQLLFAHFLAETRGLLMHACAVKDGDRGFLFLGNSGHGKSTLARLWQKQPGVTVLSDDRVILDRRQDGYWISGTPWPGDARAISALGVPLTRVFFLRHANQNQVRQLSPIEFSRGVLTRSFPTYWYAPGMDATLQFLNNFCQQQTGFELGFRPDASVLDFVRAEA